MPDPPYQQPWALPQQPLLLRLPLLMFCSEPTSPSPTVPAAACATSCEPCWEACCEPCCEPCCELLLPRRAVEGEGQQPEPRSKPIPLPERLRMCIPEWTEETGLGIVGSPHALLKREHATAHAAAEPPPAEPPPAAAQLAASSGIVLAARAAGPLA